MPSSSCSSADKAIHYNHGHASYDLEEKKSDPPASPNRSSSASASLLACNNIHSKIQSSRPHYSSPQQQQQQQRPSYPTYHLSPTTATKQQQPPCSRSKSWTDQRAPEPFSSPTPYNHQSKTIIGRKSELETCREEVNNRQQSSKKKHHGHGNLFQRSASLSSCGINDGNYGGEDDGAPSRRSLHGSGRNIIIHGKNNVHGNHNDQAIQRENSEGSRIALNSRRPSFTQSDFPLLSPAKPKHDSANAGKTERQASWSAVIEGSDKDATATSIIATAATDSTNSFNDIAARIPPLPLCDMATEESSTDDILKVDEEVESSDDEEDEDVAVTSNEPPPTSPLRSNRISFEQQRQRAHSFHHYPPNHRIIHHEQQHDAASHSFSPFSTFTTMSIAALQNDIGTLLARCSTNRVDEAIHRYRLSIESARVVLDGLKQKQDEDCSHSEEEIIGSDGNNEEENGRPRKKCPKVTEAEGLAWFRQKLLRGDIMVPPAPPVPTEPLEDGRAHHLESRHTVTVLGAASPSDSFHDIVPPPFQPAGFGGCVLQSPRRLRSASFCVADLVVCPPHSSSRQPQQQKLTMPSIEKNQPLEAEQVPKSPARPLPRPTRMASCPVTAPHPGKSVIMSTTFQPRTPQPLSRAYSAHSVGGNSSSLFHRHAAPPLDDIVHDIHQHQKLDCPDEVYSCNGLTPLGLEYICDPLPVLGSSLRRLVLSGTEDDDLDDGNNGGSTVGRYKKKMIDTTAIMMESAALIASRLNLASLEYRIAGGGVSDKLQHVLDILELALEDCHEAMQIIADHRATGNSSYCKFVSTLFCLLKGVVHSNIGTVNYRLNKVRDSMVSFEAAKAALENNLAPVDFDLNSSAKEDCNHIESEPHDDNRFPPRDYLLLVVRLNLSRVSLRLAKPDEAANFRQLIFEDDKPHRRNNSRLFRHQSHHGSLRRSNSFSAASSALETAIAAYGHDISRRSKWLHSVAEHYVTGLIHESKGESTDYKEAWHHYNRLLSTARVKLDHRHPYICALLERRGAVLFEQRKLQCSMLSYLACLKILEHQQSTGSTVFNMADLSRVLYAVARVLHDNEEYHDALHMYQRALACQRALAAVSGRPSLGVITTLCNISRVHHLSGEIDAALAANREVLELTTILVGGKMEHPFLIHRLKVEGNILVEAGRLEDAMGTFIDAARRCSEDGREQMMTVMMGDGSGSSNTNTSQEDADAGDSSVLSIRSATALAQIIIFHPSAAAA
mmetsp:Transcript_24619/g.53068  ORF Transcript_24619/g.53068 Transcript_24619/m.53068 type:complete len:1236 (+) Transcript_24619:189-3896(+)|eukprot:CAMPEP_0172304120 /NCGR_PEP_ID=MMETSP1058-20130122/5563_1 /TAXON_ID=83371 /ORGANISM="Detonula confervacea, Strain CCMP 353" /LENGTH=1235 /DNA_ID=CAMNT_0013015211 /DNA_START=172 /DNA_END=3879 /DNA_ORIENTATION=+